MVELDAAAGMLAGAGQVAKIQAAFLRVVHQFQLRRHLRPDHVLELERINAAEVGWQRKVATTELDRPFHLRHAGQDGRHVEMPLEIQQVGGRGHFQQYAARIDLQLAQPRQARRRCWCLVQQRQQGGQRGLALRVDRHLLQVAPATWQRHRLHGRGQGCAQAQVQFLLAAGCQQCVACGVRDDERGQFLTLAPHRLAQHHARFHRQPGRDQRRFDQVQRNALFFDLDNAVAAAQQQETPIASMTGAVCKLQPVTVSQMGGAHFQLLHFGRSIIARQAPFNAGER